jgi:hypothetical protein
VVLATRLGLGLPHATGDPRHVGAAALYVPQPGAHAGLELSWGPAQLSPSVGILGEPGAAYLQLGLRTSLRLARSLSVDVEAVSWLPAAVPDEPGRCSGGTRAGIGVRGALAQGVLGFLQYSAGAGDCEPGHSLTLGAALAFGEYPLRRIPTPEEAGVPRLWLGLADPVLDCNGWMLDDQSLLPLFKYGDPDPHDPTLIRRGEETFRIGEHFDIDRRGRLYRPHQYTALAAEHEFRPAPVRDKLALPECAVGPRHRFHTECRLLADALAQAQGYATVDRTFGAAAPLVMALQLHRRYLSEEEVENPRRLAEELAGALAASRGLRPAMGVQPPPGPLGPASGVAAGARADRRTLDETRLSHIFRKDPGHVLDTPENRQRVLEVANRDENRLGTDRFGVDWYGQIHEDGTQTWVRVRKDKSINAGVNPVPRLWSPVTGLSAPEPPNSKEMSMSEKALSPRQAYLAMFAFIEQMQRNLGSEDFAMLLSDLSLLPDGSSADPACWPEWEEAIERALREPTLADLVLYKK